MPVKIRVERRNETERMRTETRMVKELIKCYMEIVKKNVCDMVPKTIMAFLVNKSKGMAQSILIKEIYRTGNFELLLAEDPEIK